MLIENFELQDLYKAALSLVAGLVLGYEREMKDKAAGLKTITIICLGSTLFTLLSYKFAGNGDPTRIASYIVSGIGFLGAGVIFKEGFTVYGLTTAGIIWMAAAIGMALGFGETVLAFSFLIFAFFVIYTSPLLIQYMMPQYQRKVLTFSVPIEKSEDRHQILKELDHFVNKTIFLNLEKTSDLLQITAELHIKEQQISVLEDFLLNHPSIKGFQI